MRLLFLAALLLAGCGGGQGELTESELNKAAATLAHDADVTVNRQIKELRADEEPVTEAAPKAKTEGDAKK